MCARNLLSDAIRVGHDGGGGGETTGCTPLSVLGVCKRLGHAGEVGALHLINSTCRQRLRCSTTSCGPVRQPTVRPVQKQLRYNASSVSFYATTTKPTKHSNLQQLRVITSLRGEQVHRQASRQARHKAEEAIVVVHERKE